MNTSKFVAPNTVFDSSVAFLRNTTFDSSVYLQGVTHITLGAEDVINSSTPYALVVGTIGTDVSIQYRQLGTMAWEASAGYYYSSQVDGLISDVSLVANTKIQDVSTAAFTYLEDLSTRVDGIDLLIDDVSLVANNKFVDVSTAAFTYLEDLSTRVDGIDLLIDDVSLVANNKFVDVSTAAFTYLEDLSTRVDGKIDGVANVPVTGDASLYAYELNNVAYLKKIVAGSDIVITEDASTITISGAASTVSKYTDTFDPTGITQYYIPNTSTLITDGFVNVAVYEGNQQVFPDINVDASGNITIVWAEGSLSPTVKVVAMG